MTVVLEICTSSKTGIKNVLRKEGILKYERFRLGELEILKLAVNEWTDVEVYKAEKKFESTALRRNIKMD